ncbi:unnamed protein product [Leptidea sinapis]|uniref:VWFC domain-containing protein n=1 Tax=Leptidea sinapis TaxID=189913 RepID=A0A5E4QCP2_9NEOP|nr:unnamed protein product [Leptidea sinapis]
MRGGFLGSICFLAFLLFSVTNCQNLSNSSRTQNDLKRNGDSESTLEIQEDNTTSADLSSRDALSKQVENSLLQTNDETAKDVNSEKNEDVRSSAVDSSEPQVETDKSEQALASTTESSLARSRDEADDNDGESRFGQGLGIALANTEDNDLLAGNQGTLSNAASNSRLGSQNMYPFMSNLPVLSPASSQAYANAQALASSVIGSSYQPLLQTPDLYPGLGGQYSKATAIAQAQTSSDRWNPSIIPSLNNAYAQAQATSNLIGYYTPGGRARLIPSGEYIIPGIDSGIACNRPGELYNLLTTDFECLICSCIAEFGILTPACVMSCSPLPEDTPFENPLNPCQICVCKHVFNAIGQTDIQIECQDNPQCITPPDIIPILPLCEKFPHNIPFPHPTDFCKICKCVAEISAYEPIQPEPLPLPEPINPQPWPMPEPWPIPEPIQPEPWPIPEPIQPELWPLPEPRPEPEPLPWPPLIPDVPPSPLPGPSPHKSCRPYPPNLPFQHPWDECQTCVCKEFYGEGIINIEVNCFTSATCCYVFPPLPEPAPEPLPLPPSPNQMCQYQGLGSEYTSPDNVCKVCVCEQFGNFIAPVCKRSIRPECGVSLASETNHQLQYIEPKCRYRLPNQPFVVDCNVCYCQTVFNIVIARCTPQPNCELPYPSGGSFSNAESSATAIAQSNTLGSALSDAYANAVAQTNLGESTAFPEAVANTAANYPFLNGIYQGYPGALSETNAVATAQATSTSDAYNPYIQSYPYYGYNQANAMSQAEASSYYGNSMASANSQADANSYYGGGIANALAQADIGGSTTYPASNAYSIADAMANAQANSMYLGQQYSGLQYPYSTGGYDQANAQAQADAYASQLYSDLYQYPSNNLLSMYQPGAVGGWDSTNPYGQLSGGSSVSAQSLTQVAAASGRPLLRSGPGLCKYDGDKYHHNCQACFCFRDNTGGLFTLCLGNPCGKK